MLNVLRHAEWEPALDIPHNYLKMYRGSVALTRAFRFRVIPNLLLRPFYIRGQLFWAFPSREGKRTL